jgi:hypothetical protein
MTPLACIEAARMERFPDETPASRIEGGRGAWN